MRNAETEAATDRRNRRIGEFIEGLGQGVGLGGLEDGRVVSIRIRFPTEAEPTTLLVVRASAEVGPRIAFIGAFSAGDALLAWRARAGAAGMKWREDIPWSERAG